MSRRRLLGRKKVSINSTLYDGLLAGFHLDETSGAPVDFVGNLGITTSLNLVAGGAQGQTGKLDKSIYIVDGQVNLNTNSLLGGLSQFTFAAWVKGKDISGQIPTNIASSLGGSRMYAFTSKSFFGGIYISGVEYGGTFTEPFTPDPLLKDRFYLYLFEWDGTTLRAYIDNQISTTTYTTPVGTIQKGTAEVIGGGWRSFAHAYQNIDEALYWNRVLTPDEKTSLWNNGNGITL